MWMVSLLYQQSAHACALWAWSISATSGLMESGRISLRQLEFEPKAGTGFVPGINGRKIGFLFIFLPFLCIILLFWGVVAERSAATAFIPFPHAFPAAPDLIACLYGFEERLNAAAR